MVTAQAKKSRQGLGIKVNHGRQTDMNAREPVHQGIKDNFSGSRGGVSINRLTRHQ